MRRRRKIPERRGLDPETVNSIVRKYARLHPGGGGPITCTPAQRELSSGKNVAGWNTDGKIIFDTFAKATAAAIEFEAAGGDWQRVYECPRSRSGHCHLTSQKVKGRR